MATAFDYEAIDTGGKALLGQISAETSRDAVRILIGRGLTPVNVSAAKPPRSGNMPFTIRQTPSDQDFILTLKQMALLLNAGVPLITAIDTLKAQSIHPVLSDAFEALSKSLRSGTSFSQAFEVAVPDLPPYVFQLSAAGEAIGELGPALSDAAGQLEYEYKIRQEFRNALTYPSILVTAGLAAVLFIFIIVVPRFSAMMESSRVDLPWLSDIVLTIGMTMSTNKGLVFATTLGIAGFVTWAIKQPTIRDSVRQRLIYLPVFGAWLKEAELARWASMLGTMLRHGVDLVKALELARNTMTIRSIESRMDQIGKLVRTGKSLSAAMTDQDTFSDTALSLVQVGEDSGELAGMLESLAVLYEDSGRQRMKRFLLLLEPTAIIIIGVVIGGIVTSIMLAITSINQINL